MAQLTGRIAPNISDTLAQVQVISLIHRRPCPYGTHDPTFRDHQETAGVAEFDLEPLGNTASPIDGWPA